MRLKDLIDSRLFTKKSLAAIMNTKKEPTIKKDISVDRQINMLKTLINSPTSIFPDEQKERFKKDLSDLMIAKKILA